MSFVLLKVDRPGVPAARDADDESVGLDITQHGEEAYVHERGMSSAVADFRPTGTQSGYASAPVSVS